MTGTSENPNIGVLGAIEEPKEEGETIKYKASGEIR